MDALDLEPQELGGTLAQRLGGALALGLDQRRDACPQLGRGDAHEAPGLHQADAGRAVRGLQQLGQQFGRHLAAAEMAHVAALGDGAVDAGALFVGEGMFVHGRNKAAAATGSDGMWKWM